MPKKILVVEDSAFFRKMIIEILNNDQRFEVAGYARNGVEALKQLKNVKVDAITLDLAMPEMDGFEFLEKIMEKDPKPVLVLSENIKEETQKKEVLEKGAKDCFEKDEMLVVEERKEHFLKKLEKIANATDFEVTKKEKIVENKATINLVIIGSSTGGPKGLHKIIQEIEEDFPVPIVIVQHMANGFTKSLAENLNDECAVRVREVERGDILEKGVVYIAPAGYQTKIERQDEAYVLNVSKDYSDGLYKPSVDVTIESANKYFGKDLLISILTGMGEDGKEASIKAKENGATVFAESKETAVVFGMPKAIIEAGIADEIVAIEQMYQRIRRKVYKKQ